LLPKTQVDCGGQFDFCAGSCKKHRKNGAHMIFIFRENH
jgi:hypothetical protein